MAPQRNAALGFIFVTLLIDITGWGIIIPVMPNLMQQLTGRSVNEVAAIGGWMLLAYAVMQFFFSPVLGGLSDRFGRRPVLLLSLAGFAADYLFQALAPTLGWLFVGRLLAGITGASITTASAYIADVSTPEKKAQNFGLIGVAFGVGFILGPLIGGLCSKLGTRAPFYVAAGITFLNFLYGYFFLPESLSKENRRAFSWKRANPVGSLLQLAKNPILIGLSIALTLLYIASHAVQSNWSYYTMFRFGWSETMVGTSLAVVGLLVAAVQGGLIRYVVPKIGQQRAVYIGLLMYLVGMLLFAQAWQGWMMFAFLVPYCLGGISGPSMQGLMSSQVAANEQGELQGAVTSLMSLTAIVGPPIMTNLFGYFSSGKAPVYLPGMPFYAGGLFLLAALIVAYKTLSRHGAHAKVKPSDAAPSAAETA
jgi:MFS transporter, DHA1 family, tetracycline resistance protein